MTVDKQSALQPGSESSTSAPPPPDTPVILIEPSRGWVALRLRELWAYRELLYFLVWRDIKVRYKQTILGASWAILQPFTTMVVFSLFFGGLAQIPSDGVPYPLFSYTALVPWTFFASAVTGSSTGLASSAAIITKIYFPRILIPLADVLGKIVDFVLAFLILLVMMVFFQVPITIKIIWVPVFLLLALVTALGVGLWLSALNVQFRDIRYIVPFLTQIWMFITPIAYPSSLIENEALRVVYAFNPMVGVIEGFRWVLLNTGDPPQISLLISAVIAIVLLISGLFYFQRMEKVFADVV